MNQTRRESHGERGMTLVELAVVVSIVGVLASLAVGTQAQLTPRARINNATRESYSVITRARSEAIRRSTMVQVVLLLDAGLAAEKKGVLAMVDGDGDFSFDPDKDELLARHNFIDTGLMDSAAFAEAVEVTQSGLTTDVPGVGTIAPSLLFDNRGFSFTFDGAQEVRRLESASFSFGTSTETGTEVRVLEVSVAGAARVISN